MASDLLSLVDASALLGVSAERVRQLVVAGDLPGVRFGNAWAVSRESVIARRQKSNRRGRPLSARRAWEAIVANEVDLANVSRYRNRGEVHRFEMSAADVRFLASHSAAAVSGVVAAIEFGELLHADAVSADLYVAADRGDSLLAEVGAVADPLGRIVMRLVPAVAWDLLEQGVQLGRSGERLAPAGAVALDLMESGDPRHWVAAEHLTEGDA